MYQADVNAALAVAENILFAIHKEYSFARNEHEVVAKSYYAFRERAIEAGKAVILAKNEGRPESYIRKRREEYRQLQAIRDRYDDKMKASAERMNDLAGLAQVAEVCFVDGGASVNFFYRGIK